MKLYSAADIRKKIGLFPSIPLILKPTPLKRIESLSGLSGRRGIFIKRDDLTGLAFGGNKSRKLEFIMADVRTKKADTVITWGSLQSNWCLQTAAAARNLGIRPVLLLFKTAEYAPATDGNLLLARILGAEVKMMEPAREGKVVSIDLVKDHLDAVSAKIRKEGGRPYIIPIGGSLVSESMTEPLGAIAYVDAFLEMMDQAGEMGFRPKAVVHASGSGSTQAGLLIGAKAAAPDVKIIGVSVSGTKGEFSGDVKAIAEATDRALELDAGVDESDVIVLDDYIGEGYGIVNSETARTIRRFFETEGIVLDPVYTAKAAIGLFDLVAKGFFSPDEEIIFIHTGGTPALFPYKEKILEELSKETTARRQ